jgi:UDP-glucose 4-epimerase
MENIQHLLDEGNLNFVRGSITDLALLQKFFSDADYIFHQAAIPSVPRSIKNPLASNEVNVTGTLNVLSAARDQGIKKVIFASSSSVYGDTPNLPKREDMTPNPQSPYAVTKLAAEYYCRVFTDVYGISTICLRYFNVFGARQNPDSQYAAVIPKFIKAIKEGKPPVIFGDGEQTRDFTFIKDVVHANILAAESKAFGIFNIGKGDRISINQLAQIILKLNGKENIKPLYEKGRLGDIKHSLADISKAQSFGYKPEYDVEKGIVETIRSFKYVT